jgi:excisionase family DNA binding protein
MKPEQSPVLNTEQAAQYVGLSPSTMAKLRMQGGNVPHIKLGRRCLYRREDLDAWLKANSRTSTSDIGQ